MTYETDFPDLTTTTMKQRSLVRECASSAYENERVQMIQYQETRVEIEKNWNLRQDSKEKNQETGD